MNKFVKTVDGRFFIDDTEIKNVENFSRFINPDGGGVEISFYTNDVYLGSENKMTKYEAERSIMRILKQYEQDNNITVNSIEIIDTSIEDVGSSSRRLRRLLINESKIGSNWDI